MKKALFVFVLGAALLLQGCGGNNNTAEEAVSEITTETVEVTTEAVREEGVFDFAIVADNIYFNDKKIELMSTVKDLGRGYTLEYYDSAESTEGFAFDCADLKYENVYIATVFLEADENLELEDEKIFEIDFYSYGENETKAAKMVSVDDLKIGSSDEEIKTKYGEPTETRTNSMKTTELEYKNENGDFFKAATRNGEIIGLYIGLEC